MSKYKISMAMLVFFGSATIFAKDVTVNTEGEQIVSWVNQMSTQSSNTAEANLKVKSIGKISESSDGINSSAKASSNDINIMNAVIADTGSQKGAAAVNSVATTNNYKQNVANVSQASEASTNSASANVVVTGSVGAVSADSTGVNATAVATTNSLSITNQVKSN